jgi:hypothetical protein
MEANEAGLFAFLVSSFAIHKDFARDVPGAKPVIQLLYDPAGLAQAIGKSVE